MSERGVSQSERAALNRDLIWALLWGLDQPGWPHGGWVTPRQVYDAWLDARNECGIRFADDWIGTRAYFTDAIKRLVAEGRAERQDIARHHPRYRAISSLPVDGREGR